MSVRDGLLCKVGTHRYVADVENIDWRTVQVTRRGVDQFAVDGEASLSNEVTWRRVRDNWVGGAGQEYADLVGEDESSDIRFFSSLEVDPWDRRCLSLGRSRVHFHTPDSEANFRDAHVMASGSENLVVIDDDEVTTFDVDPAAHTASAVATNTRPASITDSAVIGNDTVYVQMGSNIDRKTFPGGSWEDFSDEDTDFMVNAKGRLIAAKDNHLFELLGSGKKRGIYLNCAEENFAWKGATAAPNTLYAWGDDSIQSEIFRVPLDEATGALASPIVAAELPIGERVCSMIVYLGIAVVGTTLGLRLGAIRGDGSLQLGGLVDELEAVTDLVGAKEYVYVVGAGSPGLWRIDISRLTNPEALIPAFAAEPVTITGGAAPYTSGQESDVRKVTAVVDNTTVGIVTVGALDTISTVEEQAGSVLVDAGEIDLGWFTYGIGEPKALDSVVVEFDPHPSGSTHTVRVLVDTPTTTGVIDQSVNPADNATTLTAVSSTADVRADRFKVRLELTGDTAQGTGPVVRRVTLRVAPAPFISDEFEIPLILTDMVQSEHDQDYMQEVLTEWQYLTGLRDTRERVPFELGDYTATVRVESVSVRSGGLGGGNGLDGFSTCDEFLSGIWRVHLVTLET